MYGLSVKLDKVGYVDVRSEGELHPVKSLAGHLFHEPAVQSVCVYDEKGTARLYLKKTPEGVHREERD